MASDEKLETHRCPNCGTEFADFKILGYPVIIDDTVPPMEIRLAQPRFVDFGPFRQPSVSRTLARLLLTDEEGCT